MEPAELQLDVPPQLGLLVEANLELLREEIDRDAAATGKEGLRLIPCGQQATTGWDTARRVSSTWIRNATLESPRRYDDLEPLDTNRHLFGEPLVD